MKMEINKLEFVQTAIENRRACKKAKGFLIIDGK